MAQPKNPIQRACTCSRLQALLRRYEKSQRAIPIDFRKEAKALPKVNRGRHLIHPYPAKLLAEIPRFFLSNSILSKPGGIVLDPFCGTGTVLLEAAYQKRRWVGADSNPLARLIARVKVRSVNEERVRALLSVAFPSSKPGKQEALTVPDVVNIDLWYAPRLKTELAQLSCAINALSTSREKDFLQLCLSVCCRNLSNANPRLSVPVRLNPNHYPEGHILREQAVQKLKRLKKISAMEHFGEIVENLLRDLTCNSPAKDFRSGTMLSNACTLADKLEHGAVDLIITSPPYLGAQKYIRASSLNLGWLSFAGSKELRQLEDQTIGREHFPKAEIHKLIPTGINHADALIAKVAKRNPHRAKIANVYLLEMSTVLENMWKVLKPGGHIVLVVGNNHLCGNPFPTERYLRILARSLGLEVRLRLVDTIKSRGLMTKRNRTADIISREWVLLLHKAKG